MRLGVFAFLLAAICAAGCRGPAIRRVQTVGVDQRSGTAFAFEIDDANRHDITTVIVCNAVLPHLCYRLIPGQLETSELPAVQRILEHERQQRALDARPLTPPPPAPRIDYEVDEPDGS